MDGKKKALDKKKKALDKKNKALIIELEGLKQVAGAGGEDAAGYGF